MEMCEEGGIVVKRTPVYKSSAVLGEVPPHLHEKVKAFSMNNESDQLAATAAKCAGSIFSSFTASLTRSRRGAAVTTPPDEVNVAQVQQAVEDYNNATHNEPEGREPERRRDATNMVTGAAVKARGGANIFGDLQPSSWVVVWPCAFPTKLENQNGTVKHTAAGSPFVACMTDRSNATAMLVLCFITVMQTLFPNLVFIVFDVCNTIPDAGHNQADATKKMWKQFSPFANEFMIQLIAANCLIFFFISPQAFREIGAGNIGTVITLSSQRRRSAKKPPCRKLLWMTRLLFSDSRRFTWAKQRTAPLRWF